MRRDDQVRRRPQTRAFLNRLGREDIQHGAGQFPGFELVAKGVVIHRRLPSDIDDAAGGPEHVQPPPVYQTVRFRRIGHRQIQDIGVGQDRVDLAGRHDPGTAFHIAAAPVDADQVRAKGLQLTDHRAAEASRAHHDDRPAGNRRAVERIVYFVALVGNDGGNMVVQHQCRHETVFPGLVGMHALVVGQFHIRRQPVQRKQVLDARADTVNPAQVRRPPCKSIGWKIPGQQDVRPGDG